MASFHKYTWRPLDSLRLVAARYLAQSGYPDVQSLVDAIRVQNNLSTPGSVGIYHWRLVPGTVIIIPFAR